MLLVDASILTIFKQADWPLLDSIHIAAHVMDASGLLQLSKDRPLLKSLSLELEAFGPAYTSAVGQGGWLHLKDLHLKGNLGTALGLGSLQLCQHLTRLDFYRSRLESADLAHIASAAWPSLKLLNLTGNNFKANFLQDLCKACMPNIEEIYIGDVSGCDAVDPNFELPAVTWSKLKAFDLSAAQIDEQIMFEMLKLDLPLVETYNLSANDGSPQMILHLVHCKLPNLTHLDLSWSCVDSSGVLNLIRAEWPCLTVLSLQGNGLNVEAISLLMSCTKWSSLKGLNLSQNSLGENYIISLSDGRSLPLRYLDNCTNFMPKWVKLQWHAIQYVDLSSCQRGFDLDGFEFIWPD